MKTKFVISSIIITILFSFVLLSNAQQEDKGIGPVKSLKLKPLDLTQAASGKNIFNQKCLTCHNLDTKKLGPPLRNVVKDRSPEFIMNLLLNTDEMQKKNETIKKLIKQYNNLLMINYKLTKKDATDLLEYLRAAAEKKM